MNTLEKKHIWRPTRGTTKKWMNWLRWLFFILSWSIPFQDFFAYLRQWPFQKVAAMIKYGEWYIKWLGKSLFYFRLDWWKVSLCYPKSMKVPNSFRVAAKGLYLRFSVLFQTSYLPLSFFIWKLFIKLLFYHGR